MKGWPDGHLKKKGQDKMLCELQSHTCDNKQLDRTSAREQTGKDSNSW